MTILITGANGFLGQSLVAQLLEQGYNVVATGQGASRLQFSASQLQYEPLDFTDPAACITVFDKHKPAVAVHCGALSKPDECEKERERAFTVNVTGTENLLNAAEACGAFFIFLSTDFVFNGREGMYKEEDSREAVNYYGQTKILAEDKVIAYSHPWSIVRTVLVYGPSLNTRPNLLTSVAHSLKEGKSLKIFNDQFRTPTYVEDLASAIVKILQKRAEGIFHISGKDGMSPYDMAIAVARCLHLQEGQIQPVKEDDFEQPARRPLITGFNIEKARSVLGYEPVSFMEGLQKTFALPS